MNFLCTLFNIASLAVPQNRLCQRKLGVNPGLLQHLPLQSDALNTRLDLIHSILSSFGWWSRFWNCSTWKGNVSREDNVLFYKVCRNRAYFLWGTGIKKGFFRGPFFQTHASQVVNKWTSSKNPHPLPKVLGAKDDQFYFLKNLNIPSPSWI